MQHGVVVVVIVVVIIVVVVVVIGVVMSCKVFIVLSCEPTDIEQTAWSELLTHSFSGTAVIKITV